MYQAKTYFSFKYGCFSTEELVKAATGAGANSLALTNINSTCDAWDFVQYCRDRCVKPILGAEIRNGDALLYVLIAINNRGFRRINEFLSEHQVEKKRFPERAPQALFVDSADGFVVYPLHTKPVEELLENEFIGVMPTEVFKLLRLSPASYPEKWVIRQPVTFQNKAYYNLHRLLRAVDKNTLVSKLRPEELAGENEYFIPQVEILTAFCQYPFIITNTYRLIDACQIDMNFGEDKNKQIFSATREDDRALLEKLAGEGCRYRYGMNKKVRERLDRELGIIDQMGFTAYFLITWDMIRYAKGRGFYHVGRGSGANSLVAYCLQITDVDPIELDLYFERFLNPQRRSPPDFDIDFSHRDRDEVIDYLLKRYGKEHVALLGMYPTFQYNAIIRELGKVFGLPKSEIDQLGDGYYKRGSGMGNFSNGPEKRGGPDRIHRLILHYGQLLQNFPSNFSIHPGGMLISEEPLSSYYAVHLPPKGFPTAMLDMFAAENIGLYKLDVLSQRGLGHIKECLELVKRNRRIDVDIHEIEKFKRDTAVKERLRAGDTIGCFYIESPAMRQLIRKLRCDNYETLVAASSIIRPGVGRSGMMQQYIQRSNNPGSFEYPHPKLKEILGSTYGVMIYQEQVIQVANEWAGLEMADADLLRRATSSKYRGKGHLPMLKLKFFTNCRDFGYAEEIIAEVWRQIGSFADFSFCKAHSASFAVESYQSLYLKTYFPMEFAVAVINNFGGFYSRELYFYELMRSGARVHRACVNNSDYYTNLRDTDSWIGFVHIKGLEQAFAERLLDERERCGVFKDLADFIERTAVQAEPLELLIRAGALRFTGKGKKELLWEGGFLQKKAASRKLPAGSGNGGTKKNGDAGRVDGDVHQEALFREAPISLRLPELPQYPLEDLYDDIELMGFPASDPFVLVDDDPAAYLPARELAAHKGAVVTVLGYHITHKPVRTVRGEMMSFGTFLDVHKDWIDTVHFPQVHAAQPPRAGFYRLTGKVVEEFGVVGIEVSRVEKVGLRGRATSYKPQATSERENTGEGGNANGAKGTEGGRRYDVT
jgi:DNA polymerase-3 subunit alpha